VTNERYAAAVARLDAGDLDGADELFEEVVDECSGRGDLRGVAEAVTGLGLVERARGFDDAAEVRFEQARLIIQGLGPDA
jgi:hypothetical protein